MAVETLARPEKSAVPFDDAVELLVSKDPAYLAEHPLDVRVRGPLTLSGMERLSYIGIEVLFNLLNGKLVISTGTEGSAMHPHNSDAKARFLNQDITIHNHPSKTDGAFTDTPSVSDWRAGALSNARLGRERTEVIFHRKGILFYRIPATFNERTAWEYYREQGIALVKRDAIDDSRLTFVMDLPFAKRAQLAREFSLSQGFIVAEVSWDDAEKAEMAIASINAALGLAPR